jgi:hypothetical protein
VARDVAHRPSRNSLRDTGCAQTGPEDLPGEVGGLLVLRQEQARDSSTRSEHKHVNGITEHSCHTRRQATVEFNR